MKPTLTPIRTEDGYQILHDQCDELWQEFDEPAKCGLCQVETNKGYCRYCPDIGQEDYCVCQNCATVQSPSIEMQVEIAPDAKPTLNRRKDGQKGKMGFGYEAPSEGETDVWLTPPEIIHRLGEFKLDPCSPIKRPWDTADKHLTIHDDGLKTAWGAPSVRVWCNPPYGRETGAWMQKMAEHGNGIALIFARTETQYFDPIFDHASAFFFIRGRVKFHRVNGVQGACATAPSVLIAFDNEASNGYNAQMLREFDFLQGAYFASAIPQRQAAKDNSIFTK